MDDINSLSITGRLTKDPETKYTQSGLALTKFSLASERSVKKGDSYEKQTSFFDCQIWGKPAEWAGKDLSKGSAVTIQGEIRQERWKTDSGETRSKVIINAEKLFYQRKKGESEEVYQVETPIEEPVKSRTFDDDEIPF